MLLAFVNELVEPLALNLAEQEGLRFMVVHKEAGNGRRKIAAALTAKRFTTKTGAPWSHQAVGNILRRETIARPIPAHVGA